MDRLSGLPKWILVTGGVLLVSLIGYGMFYIAFGMNRKVETVDPSTITLDMPDAADNDYSKSRLDSYREGDYMSRVSANPVDDYWNSLGGDLVSGEGDPMEDFSYLDSGEYSAAEKKLIMGGVKTRAEVDAEHARMKAFEQYMGGDSAAAPAASSAPASPLQMTQAQRDSLQYARMEKALEMAMRYQSSGTPAVPAAQPASVREEEAAEQQPQDEERRLEIQKELPVESFGGDGIISSLDGPSDGTVPIPGGSVVRRPIKATFLKNEKITSGERVIIRLMQDLTLSDGTLIPANTHITGICTLGRRLKISVKTLHYGGRMFQTDLSVYDNDGTEGIYCPLAESAEKKSRKAKEVAGGVVSAIGSTAGTLLTGSPVVGRLAAPGIAGITSSLNSDGSVAVNITSGYEFYVYENVKEEKAYGAR